MLIVPNSIKCQKRLADSGLQKGEQREQRGQGTEDRGQNTLWTAVLLTGNTVSYFISCTIYQCFARVAGQKVKSLIEIGSADKLMTAKSWPERETAEKPVRHNAEIVNFAIPIFYTTKIAVTVVALKSFKVFQAKFMAHKSFIYEDLSIALTYI